MSNYQKDIERVKALFTTDDGRRSLYHIVLSIVLMSIFLTGFIQFLFNPIMLKVDEQTKSTHPDLMLVIALVGFICLGMKYVVIDMPFFISDNIAKIVGWVKPKKESGKDGKF